MRWAADQCDAMVCGAAGVRVQSLASEEKSGGRCCGRARSESKLEQVPLAIKEGDGPFRSPSQQLCIHTSFVFSLL